MEITANQIKAIHAILSKYDLLDVKSDYISMITNGRTTSTKKLTQDEVKKIFKDFASVNQVTEAKVKSAIFNSIYMIAHQMGIIYGDTEDDYQMNKAKLNKFCRERGTIKKDLTRMNESELKKTHRQFIAMQSKYKEKSQTI